LGPPAGLDPPCRGKPEDSSRPERGVTKRRASGIRRSWKTSDYILCAAGTALALLLLVASGAGPASAWTPPGTVISNTAEIEYGVGSLLRTTTLSNAADTVVALSDTEPPIILSAFATPSSTTNGGVTVLMTVNAYDSSGIDSVAVNLGLLGLSDTTRFRNDGVAPDTTAGDTIWNLSIRIDTTVIGDTYDLPVEVYDSRGYRSTTMVRLVVTDTETPNTSIISLGWSMRDNIRIAGNAVTVAVGWSDSYSRVYFEYRPSWSQTWRPCTVNVWSDSNPDTSGPLWSILWNTDLLPEDSYVLRATGIRTNGETDPSPTVNRVVIDRRDSWIEEWNDTATGRHVRRYRYFSTLNDTSMMMEGTMLHLPASSFSGLLTVWARMTVFQSAPAEAPAPTAGSGFVEPGAGYYRRFEREDGQTQFDDWVWLSIPYSEVGLTGSEDDLAIFRYDPALRIWIREGEQFTDKTRNIVWARVNHFTDFAVFGVAASTSLSNVLIYPNPFIPYDNDPQTGTPFVKGDATTGIIFRNVTSTVDIEIYTVGGRRISTIHATNTGGNVQWDARTDDNREVASGVYIAILRAPNGERVAKKFMVIR
jgi:hypothetical protein